MDMPVILIMRLQTAMVCNIVIVSRVFAHGTWGVKVRGARVDQNLQNLRISRISGFGGVVGKLGNASIDERSCGEFPGDFPGVDLLADYYGGSDTCAADAGQDNAGVAFHVECIPVAAGPVVHPSAFGIACKGSASAYECEANDGGPGLCLLLCFEDEEDCFTPLAPLEGGLRVREFVEAWWLGAHGQGSEDGGDNDECFFHCVCGLCEYYLLFPVATSMVVADALPVRGLELSVACQVRSRGGMYSVAVAVAGAVFFFAFTVFLSGAATSFFATIVRFFSGTA